MSEDSLSELDRFRRNAMGKSYALNLKKIFTNQSEVMSQKRQADIQDDRAFFCSELAAKCLKVLGVMKDLQKSCTLYYPVHFEDGQAVESDLKDGVTLSPTFNILVDRDYFYHSYHQL